MFCQQFTQRVQVTIITTRAYTSVGIAATAVEYMQPARLRINHLRLRFSSWVDRKKFKLRCEQLSVLALLSVITVEHHFSLSRCSGENLPWEILFPHFCPGHCAARFEKILINFLSSPSRLHAKLALI
jgi:hypothetical protein